MVAFAPRGLIARAEAVLAGVLLTLAVVAWTVTADRMDGMDAGPGTDPGALGFFIVVWVVMMAAMMFPSVLPMVVVYGRVSRRRARTALFVSGYLVTWTFAGLLAYGLFVGGRELFGSSLAWDSGGRWFAGAVLVAAAVYQLTPLKNACLTRCRGPLRFVMEAWRDGRLGAVRMGAAQGAWCVGCCWALMASLFALGVMSLAWMAFVAALIALEKLAPWRVAANRAIAVALVVLGVALVAWPDRVPGVTVPGSAEARGAMMRMDGGMTSGSRDGSMKGMQPQGGGGKAMHRGGSMGGGSGSAGSMP